MDESRSSARAYLEQLAGAGVLDSSGVFTLGEKAALGKLAAFQLPRESSWVLKVVQCAVCCGADDIDVKQTRHQTSFAFSSKQPFDLQAIRHGVTSTSNQELVYANHLAVGLRAVASGQGRPFELISLHGDTLDILSWDGETLLFDSKTVKSEVAGWLVELRVDFELKKRTGIIRSSESARRAAEESVELSTRACVCPIPLRLDGRRLDNLSPTQSSRKTRAVAPLCVAWSEPGEDNEQHLRLPLGVSLKEPRFRMTNRLVDTRVYLVAGNREDLRAKTLLSLNYHYEVDWDNDMGRYEPNTWQKQTSWLHGVVDGVVCDSLELADHPSSVQANVYYSAQGLPTDISGFALIKTANELSERRQEALDFTQSSISLLESKLRGHGGPYIKAGGLVGAGLLVSFFGPALSPLVLMLGFISSPAFVMAGIEISRANALIKKLVVDVQDNLRLLRKNISTS